VNLPGRTALSFQTACAVLPGFSSPRSKVFGLEVVAPPWPEDPCSRGYPWASTQTGRSEEASSAPCSLTANGSEDSTPCLPATVKVTVSPGIVRRPVLRTPSRSSEVWPRSCLAGKLASLTLTWKVPAGSLSEEEPDPQASSSTAAASAANPIAMAWRRVCRECLPVPRKAART
jgi:hypothetical protein